MHEPNRLRSRHAPYVGVTAEPRLCPLVELCTVDALGHTGGQRPRPDALHVYDWLRRSDPSPVTSARSKNSSARECDVLYTICSWAKVRSPLQAWIVKDASMRTTSGCCVGVTPSGEPSALPWIDPWNAP